MENPELDPRLVIILGQSIPTSLDWEDVMEILSDLQNEGAEVVLPEIGRSWLLRAIRALATLQGRPWPEEVRRKNWSALRPTSRKLATILTEMLKE